MFKNRLITVGSCAASLVALGLVMTPHKVARGQESLDSYQYSRQAQQGREITPVSVNLMGKDPNLVYIGSYLVNGQGGCNSCHTCPSYTGVNPFAVGGHGFPSGPNVAAATLRKLEIGPKLSGPPSPHTPVNVKFFLGGGTPFPNGGKPFKGSVLRSPNITPDSEGLPGGLSFADFKSAMQMGTVSAKPGHILQVMPWPTLHNLYDNDLMAIYQYLSAIPSAPAGTCTAEGQTGQ